MIIMRTSVLMWYGHKPALQGDDGQVEPIVMQEEKAGQSLL